MQKVTTRAEERNIEIKKPSIDIGTIIVRFKERVQQISQLPKRCAKYEIKIQKLDWKIEVDCG
jgi:hypothetical protein